MSLAKLLQQLITLGVKTDGGGLDLSIPNVLTIRPGAAIIEGKLYPTVADAKEYITDTQTLSILNMFSLEGGGLANSEDILQEEFVKIKNFNLTGQITSNMTPGSAGSLHGIFLDCTIANLIGTNGKIAILKECIVNGGTGVSGSFIIGIDTCIFNNGDFSACAFFQNILGVIADGSYPQVTLTVGGTINGGTFISLQASGTTLSITTGTFTPVAAGTAPIGTYFLSNCSINMTKTISLGIWLLNNCSSPIGTVITAAGSSVFNTWNARNITIIESGGQHNDNDVIKSGVTGSRPSSPRIGQEYLDTTLTKPIWFTGSVWIDATGTTV